ncbi:MAG: GTP cyclohydrolase I FolE2 [Treponema sp.]|nr:GTP cyclohydrolase I FolE2 [Treponema sp.]
MKAKNGSSYLYDVQSQADDREIPLAKVGVKGLEYPIRVLDKAKGTQYTAAKADLFVNLPHHFKGTHMSRFVEVFHRYREDLSMPRFLEMLGEIRGDLRAESAFGVLEFPYFVEKAAPVSGVSGIIACKCRYQGRVSAEEFDHEPGRTKEENHGEHGEEKKTTEGHGEEFYHKRHEQEDYEPHEQEQKKKKCARSHFSVAVAVPVSTVCPCSKAISGRGAHNQRGIVTVELEMGPFFWLEDIISLVEDSASSPVYSVIKREDEKYITERAYDNPRFVEDLVREVYGRLRDLGKFPRFSVEAENFESIHNHSAYAYAEYSK